MSPLLMGVSGGEMTASAPYPEAELQDAGVVELGDVIPGFSLDVAELFSALVAD